MKKEWILNKRKPHIHYVPFRWKSAKFHKDKDVPKHDVERQWEILLYIPFFQIYFIIWKLGENYISEIEKKYLEQKTNKWGFLLSVYEHMCPLTHKYSIWIRLLEKWNVWEGVTQHSDITCWFLLREMKRHFSLIYGVESIILSCFADGVFN